MQAVEGTVAVGCFAHRVGGVARGAGLGTVGAAPDDADEEGTEGGEAGGHDGYGGFGGSPDGDGDVVPCVHILVSVQTGFWKASDIQVTSGLLPYWWRTTMRVILTMQTLVGLLV